MSAPAAPLDPEAALSTARLIAIALTAGALLLAVVAVLSPPSRSVPALVAPAAIVGFVSLAVAYRVYQRGRERIAVDAGAAVRSAAYLRALIVSLSITEGAACFGMLSFMLTRNPFCFSGLAAHLVLAGAIWPTREALERFLEDGPPR